MNNATMVPDGLQTMDIEQVNEYLEHLMKGKATVGSELENAALDKFRRISGRVDQLHAALGRAKAQVDGFTAEINSANGELKAYANMLASAEDARRVKAEADAKEKADTEAKTTADAETKPVESDEDIQPESHEAVA